MGLCLQTVNILRLTLKLCICLALCRLLLWHFAPPPGAESYYLYQYIDAYGEVIGATLFAGGAGALWTESCLRKNR